MTVRLVSQHRRNHCQVSVAWGQQLDSSWCWLHITCQPCVFLQRSKEMEIPGSHSATRHMIGYDTMTRGLWTTLLAVLISHPVISTSLNHIRNTCVICIRYEHEEAVTSWLQTVDTHFFYVGKKALGPEWDKSLNTNGSMWVCEVYHLLHTCPASWMAE